KRSSRSGNNVHYRTVAFINQMERPAVEHELHFRIVKADLPQDCGVEIADVVTFLDSSIPHVIGGSNDPTTLHASACEPRRESHRIVVAALIVVLRPWCAAELRS